MPVGVTVLGKNRWRYYQEKFKYLLIKGIWGADDITQRMGNIRHPEKKKIVFGA